MRILIFGNHNGGKVFFDELIAALTKVGYAVDLLDWGSYIIHHDNFKSITDIKPKNRFLLALTKIPYIRKFARILLVKKTLKAVTEKYDIINVHYGNAANNPYLKLFAQKGKKLVVTIWGSDYDRLPDEARQKARKLYDAADVINFGNPDMRDSFVSYFNDYGKKVEIAGFGDSKLDQIVQLKADEPRNKTKQMVGIAKDSLVITCGYKAFHVLQHFKMIEAIEQVRHNLPKDYLLIFPLTYHRNEQYVKQLKERLEQSGLNFLTFEKFLTDDEVSRIRLSSDIYITIPESDVASSSLLEYLTAGNVVIAGDWLPYGFHRKLGLYFHSTGLEDLAKKLDEVLSNFPEYSLSAKDNADIVRNTFAWDVKIKEWQKMFEVVMSE